MKLIIDSATNERVYELRCSCGEKGGEIRFSENHGRVSDAALEQELNTIYSHDCGKHG